MFTFLHLYFVPPCDEFLVKSNVRYTVRTTLADNFKWIWNACNDIASKIYTSFDHPYGALNGSFDKPFWRLVDDFPYTFS